MAEMGSIFALDFSKAQLHLSIDPAGAMKMKAEIPEELKAAGTMVQKFEVKMTPEGPKVDLLT